MTQPLYSLGIADIRVPGSLGNQTTISYQISGEIDGQNNYREFLPSLDKVGGGKRFNRILWKQYEAKQVFCCRKINIICLFSYFTEAYCDYEVNVEVLYLLGLLTKILEGIDHLNTVTLGNILKH